jgi:hypothetical protein
MLQGNYVLSNIKDFKVTPINTGVGYYPAKYHFDIWPQGDIWAYSTIVLTMPPGITISSQQEFQKNCASNLVGFTNILVTCKTRDNLIWVNQGFDLKATSVSTETTSSDKSVRTPYIAFDLIGFVNPRSTEISLPWNVTIQDSNARSYYNWQVGDRPTI